MPRTFGTWILWCINWRRLLALIISHYKKIGYNINVLQQTACLVVNQITVGNFRFLYFGTPVGRTSDLIMVLTQRLICCWDGRGLLLLAVVRPTRFTCWISYAPVFSFMYCWVLIFALSPFYISFLAFLCMDLCLSVFKSLFLMSPLHG